MRRIALLLSFSACVILVTAAAAQQQVKLLRHPSYHSGKVAFSYMGDIWVANEDGSNVQRLTDNVARDVYPRFSPDGKWIAFSSNRRGNYDVYVISATGGAPTQLTFHSASDIVVGWTPDSKSVIFQSSRGLMYPGIPNLYTVAIVGGLEEAMPTDWGYSGSFSPDGKRFAFNRHPMVWWRQHYRGSYAADLWVLDTVSKKYTHISDDEYKGNYFWPMIAGNGDVYFVSDRLPSERGIKPGSKDVLASRNNIWKLSAGSTKPVQVTHHSDGRVFFPTISSDGKTIVYENNFGIWKLDTATGKTSEIKIDIVSDEKTNDFEVITIRNEADSYDLSPSSRRAAISAHGEIFTVATDRGDVQRVTASYSRESQPAWSPDGKWIAFISDKTGQDEVWIARENGSGLKKISDSAGEKSGLRWAPDSASLIYSTSDHKLNRVEVSSGATKTLLTGEASSALGAQFSPDGKWIAYAMLDNDLRPHVYVIPSTGISNPNDARHVGNDDVLFSETTPMWTPDGKRLLFLAGAGQRGNAGTSAQTTSLQLYSVALTREEKNIADHGIDSEEEAVAADRLNRQRAGDMAAAARGSGMPGGEQRNVEVKIDFEGINRRARQVSHLGDSVTQIAVSPDSRTYAIVAVAEVDGRPVPSVYTIAEDGSQLTRITQATPQRAEGDEPPQQGGGFGGGINTLRFSRDGRTLFFHEREGIYAVSLGAATPGPTAVTSAAGTGGATTARTFERRRITFTARVDVDHRLERQQVFNEAWRIMRDRFYDPAMHGVDWAKARSIYEPMMQYVADQEEMHDLISEMIGELNASHTGISYTPTLEERDRMTQTRFPGFELAPSADGYYKISYIYRNGPADHDYVKLDAGDYILAIDGHDVKSGDNYWKWLGMPRGQKIEFLVNSKPSADGAWKTWVEPISTMANTTLQYQRWVDQRTAMVAKLSNGEIGYLHIRSMDAPSLRKFQRDLVENHYKKALIIDQRFNPGGGIDQELLEILSQKQYQKTRGRGSVEITRPQFAFFGPMVVMENERSTSDAEVFPDGFRTLGLGKVVGVTTYGAVIGTGAYRLLDGSSIRTPGSGLWNVKGYNLENYGVPPDVYVDNTPEDFFSGRDEQIEKAVEVLKLEIQQRGTRQSSAGGK
jgi:tricorn protease